MVLVPAEVEATAILTMVVTATARGTVIAREIGNALSSTETESKGTETARGTGTATAVT